MLLQEFIEADQAGVDGFERCIQSIQCRGEQRIADVRYVGEHLLELIKRSFHQVFLDIHRRRSGVHDVGEPFQLRPGVGFGKWHQDTLAAVTSKILECGCGLLVGVSAAVIADEAKEFIFLELIICVKDGQSAFVVGQTNVVQRLVVFAATPTMLSDALTRFQTVLVQI